MMGDSGSDPEGEDEDMLAMYCPAGSGPPPKISILPKSEKKFRPVPMRQSVQLGLSPAAYSPAMESPSEKYGSRTKSGDTIFHYKCKDSETWMMMTGGGKRDEWKIEILEPTKSLVNSNYKCMFQNTKDMVGAMDRMVQDLGKITLEDVEIKIEEPEMEDAIGVHQPHHASLKDMTVEDALYVGRVRSDGRLTSGSAYFEGSLEDSGGHTVALDLSAASDFRLFSGQVCVVEGKNELGKYIRVAKIHEPPLLPLPSVENKNAESLRILVAAGPFTPSDSVKYEPLDDFVSVLEKEKPDICILIGPFIDASHKMIEEGMIKVTFEELFQSQVKQLKQRSPQHTKIIVVSSYKDVHGQPVYPTPCFEVKSTDKVTFLPDPATFSVNGIVIGVTSTDILMHLSKTELSHLTISGDRMTALSRHLLVQRNYYPLYPPDESVPLDVKHFVEYGRMPNSHRPHILILPSDIRSFIKDVEGTVVVNPERLTKTTAGGTYARLHVQLSSSDKFVTSLADFCSGEIVKI